MKTLRSSTLLALALGFLTAGSALGATATVSANAEIVQAISVTNTIPLRFGTIIASGSGGTVTIPLGGGRTSTGGVTLAFGTDVGIALFSLAGEPTHSYAFNVPTAITLDDGAGHSMTANSFTNFSAFGNRFSSGGIDVLSMGATLQVGANQPVGRYIGSFTITFDYN